MNTPNKNVPKPIISDETEGALIGAFATILSHMATYGDTISTEKPGRAEFERAAVRAFNALDALRKDRQEREVAAYRAGVRDSLASYLDTARQEKSEYDSLSPTLRAKLGAFPTFVNVPVKDVAHVFEGVQETDMVKKLITLGYKVSKSAQGALSLKIDLPKSILEGTNA